MNQDPVVAEVRAARAELMKECGYDLNRLFQRLREYQQAHPERLITKEQLDARRGEPSSGNASPSSLRAAT